MALLVLPACLLVLGLLIGPMFIMFRISLNTFSPTRLMIEAFSFDNYLQAAADPYYQEIIVTTLGMALLCMQTEDSGHRLGSLSMLDQLG